MIKKLFALSLGVISMGTPIEESLAQGLAGTWSGTLISNEGPMPVVYKFAPMGNPIYSYQTQGGLREMELTTPGQRLDFVPPGGGVMTLFVQSLSVSPDHVSYTLALEFTKSDTTTRISERESGNIHTNFSIVDEVLETTFIIQSNNITSHSQYGISIPGAAGQIVYRGRLKRAGNSGSLSMLYCCDLYGNKWCQISVDPELDLSDILGKPCQCNEEIGIACQ